MTRLIDADALLEAIDKRFGEWAYPTEIVYLINIAPTVQREGWLSVEELQKVYDDMFSHKDIARVAQSLWNLIHAK